MPSKGRKQEGEEPLPNTQPCLQGGLRSPSAPCAAPQPLCASPREPSPRVLLSIKSQISLGREAQPRCPRAVSVQASPRSKSHSVHRGLRTSRGGLGPGHRPAALWECPTAPSLLSKPFRLLDGVKQLLLQLFVALVGREIQAVEAGERAEAGTRPGTAVPAHGMDSPVQPHRVPCVPTHSGQAEGQ